MLNQLSDQIHECHEHAEYCARKAAQQTNPELRQDYVRLAELWRNLARSYAFTERLSISQVKPRDRSTICENRSGEAFGRSR